MDSKRKPVPDMDNEDEERGFWATHDSTEYIDWSKAEKNPTFSRLKPSRRSVHRKSLHNLKEAELTND